MARINVVFKEIGGKGEVFTQANNLEGADFESLSDDAKSRLEMKLINRTCSRLFGPNSAFMVTGRASRGIHAGIQGVVGKRVWGMENAFNDTRQFVVYFKDADKPKADEPDQG